MELVGRDVCGNMDPPRGEDMWWAHADYVEGAEASWLADFEKRSGCYITWDYAKVRETAEVNWNIFDLQDDGYTVVIGRWPNRPEDGGRIQPLYPTLSMRRSAVRLFLYWYLVEHKLKAQWLGVRPWIYYKALHASVHERVPFACQKVPPRGSGGYDHWHCSLRRRHSGEHRFRNYTWTDGADVVFTPEEQGA